MTRFLFLLTGLLCSIFLPAQNHFPVNGAPDQHHPLLAFTGMTLVVSPTQTIEHATLLVRQGWIEGVGSGIAIPDHAVVVDLQGYTIYPSFIELVSNNGVPEKPKGESKQGPQMDNSSRVATGWNEAVTPEFQTHEVFYTDDKAAGDLRQQGFGAALVHRPDGILRGTGAVVMLGNQKPQQLLVKDIASRHFSFSKGSSGQDFPSSQMGSIALIRQTLYDADWYAAGGWKEGYNLSLQALPAQASLPLFFHVNDKLEILRAATVAKEFGWNIIAEGSGNEYQRAAEIKNSGAALILPVHFPAAPEVMDAWDAYNLPYTTLKHWELAPANPAYMEDYQIRFALTSNRLEQKKDFLPNLRKAVAYGLSESTALAALTTIPAEMAGVQAQLGTLEKGKRANFIITSGNLFDSKTLLFENWINGEPYVLQQRPVSDVRGAYTLRIEAEVFGLLVRGSAEKPEFSVVMNADTLSAKGQLKDIHLSLQFEANQQLYRLSGWYADSSFYGSGQVDDKWVDWDAAFGQVYAEKAESKTGDTLALGAVVYPFQAYGYTVQPGQQTWLIRGATVWTNEAEGILTETDVLIKAGKIAAVGKNLKAENAILIDGSGKHVTCGIIDEHSHIAISKGVNEGTQSISAEVRIGDVINSEDVNIYRQLAGGVTTSQLLHGSANAIGGQSAIIKLRWGVAPEQLKFEGADGFIKFALGENVKQSNWGDLNTTRFPQTRMGVEQVMEDGFSRAVAYMEAKNQKGRLVRRDLELDALAEILQEKRFITCHSYVQSEINMLMKLADKYGFTVNTFTHILEGYKVADKMQAHGAGASTFSDWWAYKYEVVEAIPFNAALLTQVGVLTAINSDDAEMARRLNQEAAKAVKYGGLSEEEAWKLVSLNPAKLLHIDHRVGSLKPGKDADVVVWSNNPLSIYAVAEKTFVDGILYYDREEALLLQQEMQKEKTRLIQAVNKAVSKGERSLPAEVVLEPEYHCDTDFVFTQE